MMEAVNNYQSTKECPVCRKTFTVLWPMQWAFKRGMTGHPKYICSWHCLRAYDENGEEKVKRMPGPRPTLTEEQEMEACRIAIETGDPRPYLTECGVKDTATKWHKIKTKVKDTDPDLYAKLPRVLGRKTAAKREDPDALPARMEETPLKMTDPEPKARRIIIYRVTAIDTEMGSFRHYRRSGFLDWETGGINGTIRLNVDEWRQLMEDLPKIMEVLGVEE